MRNPLGKHCISQVTAADAPQKAHRTFKRAPPAGGARRIRAVTRQQHAHVHLVRLGLEAMPKKRRAPYQTALAPGAFTVNHPGNAALRSSRHGRSRGMPALLGVFH